MIKWISKKPHALLIFFVFSITIIAISLGFNFLSKHILAKSSLGIYNKDFWVNLLINLNSSIVDFLFLGLVVLYFDKKKEKKREEDKLKELNQMKVIALKRDLKDYAEHSTLELDLKKAGIIHELCNMNENTINTKKIRIHSVALKNIRLVGSDLSGLSLFQTKLENIIFNDCTIRSLNLMESSSKYVKFLDCTIRNLKLNNGKFKAICFERCGLINSRMNNADLSSAMFFDCDLQDVTFDKSNLRSANFLGSKNINIESLCRADCLDYIVAEDDVLAGIEKLRPEVKMKQKRTSGNRTTVTQP